MPTEAEMLARKLQAPFHPSEVQWLPQNVKGSKALAVPYIDARSAAARLDEVFGVLNWQDDYLILEKHVVCHLSVRSGPDAGWVTKKDVGEIPQGGHGDPLKGGYSDSFKRAAVKLGIGRFLYAIEPVWCDYDATRKQLARIPHLPEWALPEGFQYPGTVAAPTLPASAPPPVTQSANGSPTPATAPAVSRPAKAPPRNYAELAKRLELKEKEMASKGLCKPGELAQDLELFIAHAQPPFPPARSEWTGDHLQLLTDHLTKLIAAAVEAKKEAVGPPGPTSQTATSRTG